jgi:DNA-binding response OmpR family regulator
MTILLLDDDIEIGLIAKQFLSPYEVRQAFTISEAKALLTKETFQLLLIDVTLPDGSGFDFCSSVSSDSRYCAVRARSSQNA